MIEDTGSYQDDSITSVILLADAQTGTLLGGTAWLSLCRPTKMIV